MSKNPIDEPLTDEERYYIYTTMESMANKYESCALDLEKTEAFRELHTKLYLRCRRIADKFWAQNIDRLFNG